MCGEGEQVWRTWACVRAWRRAGGKRCGMALFGALRKVSMIISIKNRHHHNAGEMRREVNRMAVPGGR